MTISKFALLQQMPIFGGITEEALQFLLDRTKTIYRKRDQYFFHEGDRAESLFVLERGRVEIQKRWQGRDHALSTMRQGDCFGEMAIIDFCPRSASVRALEDCRALELSAKALHDLYQEDATQFTMIYMNLARELSRRLREANELLFEASVQLPLQRDNSSYHAT